MRKELNINCSNYQAQIEFLEDFAKILSFSYISRPNIDELFEALNHSIDPKTTIYFQNYEKLLILFKESKNYVDEMFKNTNQTSHGIRIIFN